MFELPYHIDAEYTSIMQRAEGIAKLKKKTIKIQTSLTKNQIKRQHKNLKIIHNKNSFFIS